VIVKILLPAAIAAALLAPVPSSAADLGPPGYYPQRVYDRYHARVVRKRIVHEKVVVEPLFIHRRPLIVERPVVVEHPIFVDSSSVEK
jgi:hypothetical protein